MTTSTSADALIAALHEPGREQLLDLVRNPLRLTLLCMTWDGSSLPDTQADLYARYLRKVYEWNRNLQELRDHARRCGTTITNVKRDLNRQLGELAKAALDLPRERFRLSQALVEEFLGEELDETSLSYLALRLGWLNRVGRDGRGDSIFAFYHATFQEYFAALAVEYWDYFLPKDHVDRPVVGKEYRIFEKQWKQVILFWLGRGDVGDEEKEGFIRALVEFEDGCGEWSFYEAGGFVDKGFYEYQAYFLAAAAINEFKVFSVANEIVHQVVKWGFNYFNFDNQEPYNFLDPIQESARKMISVTVQPLAVCTLINIFKHYTSESTLTKVAEILGKISPGNPMAIKTLINIIATTRDEFILWNAAEILETIEPGNPDVISALHKIIVSTKNEFLRSWAVESLQKINPGNPEVIAVLLNILATTKDEDIQWRAANSLWKIDPDNSKTIMALVDLITKAASVTKRIDAAESLGRIGQGNAEAITTLVNLIVTSTDSFIQSLAARSLGNIKPGNQDVIMALVNLINTTEHEYTRWQVAESLGRIGQGNPEAIATLEKILRDVDADGYTRRQAAQSLGNIAPGNKQAILALVEILRDAGAGDSTRRQAAQSLGNIAPGNKQAIAAFVAILRDAAPDPDTRWHAAWSLEKIDPGNEQAITAFVQILRDPGADRFTRCQAAESLGEIDLGNEQAIAALVETLQNASVDSDTRRRGAWSLEKIDPGNEQAVSALVEILQDADAVRYTRGEAAESLAKILTTPQHHKKVISALKDCLSDEVHQNNFEQFETSYEVIWNCAENLPYPDFYQAWHNPPTTPHPEIENTTPTAPTPFTQHHNLTLLPQSLNQALQAAHHPPNNQPICIDGSRFSDPTNPALQIYTALKKANCPPINNKPHTIAQLQAYCEDELSTAKIALILYEAPTDPPPQGFDMAVLNQLARFSHPPIAVVVGQPLPECRLPQFLENDPDLIAKILQWLQNLER